ncbi:fused DSP-PTPase phosphatase/NAD kinase-like protein [Alteromonas ponticola]|uniref:Serine/threonine protein phosphatase n=1 Tax=Alteromonas ponticola TaxID=2720613 RepID=A0ABX1R5K3_9ALTE|nr:protein tyrosine phosphatase family protein [Alteromonas ponticola]NMH61344.1 hypothetical protein [Alteromonas ponticola]
MTLHKFFLITFLQLLLVTGVHAANERNDAILSSEIPNIVNPAPNVYSSGQPSEEQFQQMKTQGIKHVVNLRPDAEQDWDEKSYVESLGMQYHHIPVAGEADINLDNAAKLDMLLAKHSGEPIVVHCASGNRVGALVALNEGDEHQDIDAAITTGKQWGLTRLEPVVRDKLQKMIK